LLHGWRRFALQENSESEYVRDEKQRHYQSWEKESGAELSRQQSRVIGLVESAVERQLGKKRRL
jgi:hypothetical protein